MKWRGRLAGMLGKTERMKTHNVWGSNMCAQTNRQTSRGGGSKLNTEKNDRREDGKEEEGKKIDSQVGANFGRKCSFLLCAYSTEPASSLSEAHHDGSEKRRKQDIYLWESSSFFKRAVYYFFPNFLSTFRLFNFLTDRFPLCADFTWACFINLSKWARDLAGMIGILCLYSYFNELRLLLHIFCGAMCVGRLLAWVSWTNVH